MQSTTWYVPVTSSYKEIFHHAIKWSNSIPISRTSLTSLLRHSSQTIRWERRFIGRQYPWSSLLVDKNISSISCAFDLEVRVCFCWLYRLLHTHSLEREVRGIENKVLKTFDIFFFDICATYVVFISIWTFTVFILFWITLRIIRFIFKCFLRGSWNKLWSAETFSNETRSTITRFVANCLQYSWINHRFN